MESHPPSLNQTNSSSSINKDNLANNLDSSPKHTANATGQNLPNVTNSEQPNQLANNSRTIPSSEVQLLLSTDTDSEKNIIKEHNRNHQIVQSLLQDYGNESKPIEDSFANANLSYHTDIVVPTLYVSNTSSSHHLTQTQPKADSNKNIKVVNASIALLYNEFGQVFVSQRRAGCDYERSLEFPGGKIELGETPEQAIIRELEEEIGVDVLNMEKLCVFIWRSADREHIVHIYKVIDYIGEPYGKEGQDIFWFNIDELDDNRFMPASQDLISCIRNTEINLQK